MYRSIQCGSMHYIQCGSMHYMQCGEVYMGYGDHYSKMATLGSYQIKGDFKCTEHSVLHRQRTQYTPYSVRRTMYGELYTIYSVWRTIRT